MILNNLPRKHEYAAPSNPVTNFSKFFRCSIVNILQYRNSGMKKKKRKKRGEEAKREKRISRDETLGERTNELANCLHDTAMNVSRTMFRDICI